MPRVSPQQVISIGIAMQPGHLPELRLKKRHLAERMKPLLVISLVFAPKDELHYLLQ